MNQTLVIGSAVVDVIVRVEHLPKCGEDVHVSRQSRSLGGCAYLVSDILRHFGAPYSLCTAVGGGMYGDFVYELSAMPQPGVLSLMACLLLSTHQKHPYRLLAARVFWWVSYD